MSTVSHFIPLALAGALISCSPAMEDDQAMQGDPADLAFSAQPIDLFPPADPLAFATFGRWDRAVLTWHLVAPPPGISSADARAAAGRAMATWAQASGLTFQEGVSPAASDIVISTQSPGTHGDACPFDSGIIAHAFFPDPDYPICPFGEIHLSSGYVFTTGTDTAGWTAAVDFESIILHEVGHALGLGHSAHAGAVMASHYGGVRRGLHDDDVAGIQALYGPDLNSPDAAGWLGQPFWEGPGCVSDGEPAELCVLSTGLVGRPLHFAVLEHDAGKDQQVAVLDAVVSEDDFDSNLGRHVTCRVWIAHWTADGAGYPEYLIQAETPGLAARTSPITEDELLYVGKKAPPPLPECW